MDDYRWNTLLAKLSEAEFTRLRPGLRVVDLRIKQPIYQYRHPMDAVYFPLDSVFSLVTPVSGERGVVEVATVGFEGMVGLPLFLGSATSPTAAFCQVPGRAAELSATDFREFLHQDGQLHGLLHRYTETMITQMAQNVACNVAHLAEQRAARWVLTTGDRTRGDRFPLTQEFLAQMLGVRRSTVSEIAGKLQADDVITYSRGNLAILDRPRLTGIACECYRIIKDEFDALAGPDA
ncbi:CRP-like cAMP-binding protein [Saccharothrix coeruleofusca]|uniref:Crp/Fnr family transcriptional regulator n=1 Tax=Saccharothrix coeruleofusca TaxID=33919 RepID=UPI001AE64505|nr:Crp/Fnr family transcriptional regulator [Saccharothrix coeruleofusca]MBP2337588.1 CRP-like cAMP-binding protein [Saccharothrix coeruleofusca]